MRFAHLSDTHLGFRQYGLYERESDFYRAFEKTIAAIIRERPDFVLHTGDLFDSPKPPPRALWVAQRCFAKLRDKGIPVYAITGNHDMLFRKGAMPPQVLYKDLNVRMLTEEEPFVVHEGVLIAGIPYRSKHSAASLKDSMALVAKKAKGYTHSVLMMHQGTDRHLKYAYEVKMSDIPDNFSYYAMGHVHARILEKFGKGWLAYPGSTELWSASEYDDYRRNGKGFYLVDAGFDIPQVQKIDIGLEREIIKERMRIKDIGKFTEELVARMSKLTKKPLLYIDVLESGLDRSTIQEVVNSRLSQHALTLRLSYSSALSSRKLESPTRSFELSQINEIIGDMIKDRDEAELARMLFRLLSEGNEELALKESERFFSAFGVGKK